MKIETSTVVDTHQWTTLSQTQPLSLHLPQNSGKSTSGLKTFYVLETLAGPGRRSSGHAPSVSWSHF